MLIYAVSEISSQVKFDIKKLQAELEILKNYQLLFKNITASLSNRCASRPFFKMKTTIFFYESSLHPVVILDLDIPKNKNMCKVFLKKLC